jgi:hypothetical protein
MLRKFFVLVVEINCVEVRRFNNSQLQVRFLDNNALCQQYSDNGQIDKMLKDCKYMFLLSAIDVGEIKVSDQTDESVLACRSPLHSSCTSLKFALNDTDETIP